MIWLFVIASSWATEPLPVRPSLPDPLSGECSESIPIRVGQPASDVFPGGGVAACSGVLEPSSSFAYLLQVEEYALGLEQVYKLDRERWDAERRGYEAQIEQITRSEPWKKSSRAARWLGRIETALLVGAVVGGYFAIEEVVR